MFAFSWSEFEVAAAKLFISRWKRNTWAKFTKWSNRRLLTLLIVCHLKIPLRVKWCSPNEHAAKTYLFRPVPVIAPLLRKVDLSLRVCGSRLGCYAFVFPNTNEQIDNGCTNYNSGLIIGARQYITARARTLMKTGN